jgi:CubicO group peptidase (beta-lactamase class C family)
MGCYCPLGILGFFPRQHYGSDLTPLMTSLLGAIGVENWQWSGSQNLSSGLSMTVRDLTRYGRLWVRGGDWDGTRVLSAAGTALATTASHPSLRAAYGLLWWAMHDTTPPFYDRYGYQLNPVFPDGAPGDAFLAAGCNRSYMLVVPSVQLVVARSGRNCVSIRSGTPQYTNEARGFITRALASIAAACSDGLDNDGNGTAD